MKRKLISMMLALCLTAAAAAACQKNDQPAETSPAATTAPAAEQTTAAPAGQTTAAPAAAAEPYEMDAEGKTALKGKGVCTYKFETEQDEAWADAISAVYVREMPKEKGTAPDASAKVDEAKYTVSSTKLILDSDLFAVEPASAKVYEVTLRAEGHDDYHLALTVKNDRPNDFTVRSIDGDGQVVDSHTFSFAEMEKLCTEETYYSSGCVMHGLMSHHAKGVYLGDLLKAAGIEFKPGMSLATRVTDAPASIEATKTFSSEKTGDVFENPESYWIKPRYTDNYKLTYENLYERDRYFITAPWEDKAIGKLLADDGSNWTLDARVALAESGLMEKRAEPMLAIQYDTFEYNSNPADPRQTKEVTWDLSRNERAFRFLYGLAMDDDTAVNVTAYDEAAKAYPVVTDESKAGLTAIEEGGDPCGTNARQAMLVFGIDIFLEGGVQ